MLRSSYSVQNTCGRWKAHEVFSQLPQDSNNQSGMTDIVKTIILHTPILERASATSFLLKSRILVHSRMKIGGRKAESAILTIKQFSSEQNFLVQIRKYRYTNHRIRPRKRRLNLLHPATKRIESETGYTLGDWNSLSLSSNHPTLLSYKID